MKRSLGSSDSLSAFMSVCGTAGEEQMMSPRSTTKFLYSSVVQDFPAMLEDDEVCHVAAAAAGEKKRRLSVEQVKALEKNFEIENKLEPERKVKLAQELGLQPRQVAIWFQNRRARWKTKQLDRDYAVLKANFDALKRNRDALQRDNDSLLHQIKELRAQLNIEETTDGSHESVSFKVEEDEAAPPPPPPPVICGEPGELSHRAPSLIPAELEEYEMFNIFPGVSDSFKEGPADSSDSSAVLNDDCHCPAAAAAAAATTTTTLGCFGNFVKMEEHGDLFSGEEACKFFTDDEQWYCSDQWRS